MGHHSDNAWWSTALLALVIFDVVSLNGQTNWEPVPASQRVLFDAPLVAAVQADNSLFRVDGRLGLSGNYGSMVGLQDIRGISPLRLRTLDDLFTQFLGTAEEYRLYQLLNVKYAFSDARELPLPSEIIASDDWAGLPANLHQLADPAPRAWMVYRVMDTADNAQALDWLADPGFDARTTVILTEQPDSNLPANPLANSSVAITGYAPERIDLMVDTPENGVLVISEMDYPGWVAVVDGDQQQIWRADVALRAVPLQAGQHQITLQYQPLSFRIGTIVSILASALIIIILAAGALFATHGRS